MSTTLTAPHHANSISTEVADLVCAIKRCAPGTRIPERLLSERFLSSMQAVELIVQLEERFGVVMGASGEDFELLNQVSCLCQMISERRTR